MNFIAKPSSMKIHTTEDMKIHVIKDYTGVTSTHLAMNFEAAVQAHLVHYGLLHLKGKVELISVKELIEVEDRDTICWNLNCCLAGACDY